MIRATVVLLIAIGTPLSTTASPTPRTRPVLLTGEVIAIDSQPIFVPPSNGSPVLIRNFVAEGTTVKKGDLVLRIEARESNNISQQEIEFEQARAKANREVADLIVKAVEADRALLSAEAAHQKAKVDAAVPREHLSALDYDRYQGEFERSGHDLDLKRKAAANAADAVARRKADGELEAKKLLFNLAYVKAQLAAAEVRATRDGVVIHGYSEWRGERCDEGTSAMPGNTAGYVLGSGRVEVRAWALEADRSFLTVGQAVQLGFDALPGVTLTARIERIAQAPQTRTAWGSGRYFQIDIQLPPTQDAPLVPGMSVLVEPSHGDVQTASTPISIPNELALEGEIASLKTIPVTPPEINEVWQYNLTQLVPDGSLVKASDIVTTFDAPDLATRLDTKKSTLNEKLRALEKMRLEHAEGSKAADIDVSQARSNAEKAARKATQPKEQIRRVDYDKLLIERDLTTKLAELSTRHRVALAAARDAQRIALQLEIAKLEDSIATLSKGLASLAVQAKQSGLVLYRQQFNGEKFSVGNQVWMGLAVATIADPEQLVVNATVPEAQATAVQIGQLARVTIPGANLSLNARVQSLGRIYHLKSRTQPIIVRDVQLAFDAIPSGVKPGAAVQVRLSTATPAANNDGSRTASR